MEPSNAVSGVVSVDVPALVMMDQRFIHLCDRRAILVALTRPRHTDYLRLCCRSTARMPALGGKRHIEYTLYNVIDSVLYSNLSRDIINNNIRSNRTFLTELGISNYQHSMHCLLFFSA